MPRGFLLAHALEDVWDIRRNLNELPEDPPWLINATCYETGKFWRFSSERMGDYRFGHLTRPLVPVSTAIASSAGLPYLVGKTKLKLPKDGWYAVNPDDDMLTTRLDKPRSKTVRLWDGGVYENLGLESLWKPRKGLYRADTNFLVVSDASAPLAYDSDFALGPFEFEKGRLVSGKLRALDIATDQTRSLRLRMIMRAALGGELNAAVVRLGLSRKRMYDLALADYRDTGRDDSIIARYAKINGGRLPDDVAGFSETFPTHLKKLQPAEFDRLHQDGFDTADLAFCLYYPQLFSSVWLP